MGEVPGPVVVQRPEPRGGRGEGHHDGGRWVAEIDDASTDRELAGRQEPLVRWGIAEFAAAEEMDRDRGYWWSPDGDALLVARVDEAPVPRWWIADPAQPSTPPSEVAYPAAGTANAPVTPWIVGLDGRLTEVPWG